VHSDLLWTTVIIDSTNTTPGSQNYIIARAINSLKRTVNYTEIFVPYNSLYIHRVTTNVSNSACL
jgi:hypothetical protein